MSYVITSDYQRVIQTAELNAITTNSVTTRQLVESRVQSILNANLLQEFDLSVEFSDLNKFDYTVIYKGNNRVYLDATAYSVTATYALNALTLQAGIVYICTTAITIGETFNASKWSALGNQYDLFFVTLPYPLFDSMTFYTKGAQIWWKDKVYTASKDSMIVDQQDELQSLTIQDIQKGNGIPGTVSGKSMWGTGTAYALTAGTLPTDSTKWTKGDNRNQMFVGMMLDMVVYELCKRIAPNNVPEARHNAWVKANEDLKAIASGNVNAQLPKLEPLKGNRIRSGGSTKEINSW